MDLLVFGCFCDELEKRAISPALMGRVLAGRAAQGVGGAAALGRQVAGAAAQGATSSRQVMGQLGGLGKHRLQAVQQGGLAARKTQQSFGAAKADLTGRIRAADGAAGKFDYSKPLRTHDGYMGAEHAYTSQYANAIARPQGVLQDPKGLLVPPKQTLTPTGTRVQTGQAPMSATAVTAQTQVAPTLVSPAASAAPATGGGTRVLRRQVPSVQAAT